MSYDQAEAAFAAGDYSLAARSAETEELRGCALVMVGGLEEGLRLLDDKSTPRAQYHRAFALWGLCEADQARELFSQAAVHPEQGQTAQFITDLLRRGEIRILFQGADAPDDPAHDIVRALRDIPYVDVVTIGYSPRADIMINYSTTLDDVMAEFPLEWEPDLFISHLVEDNPPPLGIEFAPFPTIAHSCDYRRDIHHSFHYLHLFDAVIALGSDAHADLSKISGVPTFVFPLLLHGLANLQETGVSTKRHDILLAGTLLEDSHDKAQSAFEIAQMPDQYCVALRDGFLSPRVRLGELATAKVTMTYGSLQDAIEAIGVGTCALYPSGGELGLFLTEAEGAVPYEAGQHLDVLCRVLGDWEAHYAAAARRGMERVSEVFDFHRCTQRYLNFLVHVTGRVAGAPRNDVDPIFSRIRYPSRASWRIASQFPDTPLLIQLQDQFRHALSGCNEYGCVDAVGESFLYSAITVRQFNLTQPDLIQALMNASLSAYQHLITAYPDRLAAWFNLGRLCFELNELDTAKVVFEAIRANPQLHYEANDLVFWREFQDGLFDYERMADEMVAYRKSFDEHHLRVIESLVAESVVFYLANIALTQGRTSDALALLRDNVTENTDFVPSWMLRSILNLHAGRQSDAQADLQAALGRREYMLSKLDIPYFNLARDSGLDVDSYVKRWQRLSARGAI